MDNTFNQEAFDLPRFKTVLFGYDKADIVEYLNSISFELLNAREFAKENKLLKEAATRVNSEKDYINTQKLLVAKALVDAQSKAQEIYETAQEKAKSITAKATADANAQKEKIELAIKDKEKELKAIQDKITMLKDSIKNL